MLARDGVMMVRYQVVEHDGVMVVTLSYSGAGGVMMVRYQMVTQDEVMLG